jgi:6-phosphogluconolactonase
MKFRNFGRLALALSASLVLAVGTQSCNYDYTAAFVFVTGSQYNQVQSFREDNNTGFLNKTASGAVSSAGKNPIRALVLTGGRYLYVLNQGQATTDSSGNISWSGTGIALFSVAGDGSLAYQLSYFSQGLGSRRMALSASGNYLYVLDQYQSTGGSTVTPASATPTAGNPCRDANSGLYYPAGDVTVFTIDPNTGRLTLVQNTQQQSALGTPLPYFPLGCGPIDFTLTSGFLYTAEASDPSLSNAQGQVVYAYQASTNGQLLQVPGGSQPIPGTQNISVIGASASSSYIYVLDAATNMIYTFTPGGNGLLSATSGGAVSNLSNTTGMTALTTDSGSKFLYIANTQSTGLNQPGSAISNFKIVGGGVLQPNDQQPYGVGSGPVCIFEDPTHKFLYTADSGSSTVSGALIDPNTGLLSNLRRGSTFNTVGTPTWCTYSSNTQ